MMIACIALLAVCACSKEEAAPAQVEVKLDYTLPESGNMGRGGADLYADFHNTQIATRNLTPSTYNLTFTNTTDQSSVVIEDQWAKKHAIKLISGTYRVTGVSAPTVYENQGGIDTLYLKFEEEITVSSNTSKISLHAIYDSSLLFFDAAEINKATYQFNGGGYYGSEREIKRLGDIYYCFVESTAEDDRIRVSRTSGSASLKVGKMAIEKGKYYYFGDISSEYNLPEMESGN